MIGAHPEMRQLLLRQRLLRPWRAAGGRGRTGRRRAHRARRVPDPRPHAPRLRTHCQQCAAGGAQRDLAARVRPTAIMGCEFSQFHRTSHGGTSGLAATVPALQWLGHEVWALPTVLLASRPGLGHLREHDLPPADLDAMLSALEADGCWASLDAVFTGYFPSPQSVAAAAQAIARIKAADAANPVSASIPSWAMRESSMSPQRRQRPSATSSCPWRRSPRPTCSSCNG